MTSNIVYAPFPRKNVKICPNIFIIKLKVFSIKECREYIHGITHTGHFTSQNIGTIFTMHITITHMII